MPIVRKSRSVAKSRRSVNRHAESGGPTVPGGTDQITRQSGKMFFFLTSVANKSRVNLTPLADARLSALSNYFQQYRFTWLKMKLHPDNNSTTNRAISMGFTPDFAEATGVPGTHSQVMQCPYAVYFGNAAVNPVWMTIPRSGLLGRTEQKWYECDASADMPNYLQGSIFLFTDIATGVATIELEYEVEFTNPISSAITLSVSKPSSDKVRKQQIQKYVSPTMSFVKVKDGGEVDCNP